MNIEVFENNFRTIFPNKRLLAGKLDGFSHSVWFDSGNSETEIEQEKFSGCMPEGNWSAKSQLLLAKYPHHCYQNDPQSYVWIKPDDR